MAEDDLKKQMEKMAENEFRASLGEDMHPLAQLGYDRVPGKVVRKPGVTGVGKRVRTDPAIGKGYGVKSKEASELAGQDVNHGDVLLSMEYTPSKDVWNHEFAHEGLQAVSEVYRKDPKAFTEKYGDQATKMMEYFHQAPKSGELLTELFDTNLDKVWDSGTKDIEGNPVLKSMGMMKDTAGQTDHYRTQLKAGMDGLTKAASDLLNENLGGNYAEGGMVDEEQMEMALMGGGLKDDGTEVEPTSGNDVPPGSLDEEVKDDVDIKASEGEYIIPANVVRFVGLDKLEKMVIKAEEQLQGMEDRGRIGGEPADEEDELPFSPEELVTEAVEEIEEEAPAFAEGGSVSAVQGVTGSSQFEPRVYVDEAGNQRSIIFINGRPIQTIPEGFKPVGASQRQPMQPNTPTPYIPTGTAGEGTVIDPTSTVEEESKWADPTQWTPEDFETFVGNKKNVNLLSKGLGAVGGPIGMVMGMGYKHRGNKAYEELVNRANNPNLAQEERKKYEEQIKKYEEAGMNDPLFEAPDFIKDMFDRPVEDKVTPEEVEPEKDYNQIREDAEALRDIGRPPTSTIETDSGAEVPRYGEGELSDEEVVTTSPRPEPRPSNMNKGGLVSRRPNTKKKSRKGKGLASRKK